jgi:Ca2+-binding RTX toxin-like protein
VDATYRFGSDTIDGGDGNDVVAGDDTIVMAPVIRTNEGLAEDVEHLVEDLAHVDWELVDIGQELVAVEHHLRDRGSTVVSKGKTSSFVTFHVDSLVVGADVILGGGGSDLLVGDDRLHLAPSIVVSDGGKPVTWPWGHRDHDDDDDDWHWHDGWHGDWRDHDDHHGDWDDDDHKHNDRARHDVVALGNDTIDAGAGRRAPPRGRARHPQ